MNTITVSPRAIEFVLMLATDSLEALVNLLIKTVSSHAAAMRVRVGGGNALVNLSKCEKTIYISTVESMVSRERLHAILDRFQKAGMYTKVEVKLAPMLEKETAE